MAVVLVDDRRRLAVALDSDVALVTLDEVLFRELDCWGSVCVLASLEEAGAMVLAERNENFLSRVV